jgi:hypothetical protein
MEITLNQFPANETVNCWLLTQIPHQLRHLRPNIAPVATAQANDLGEVTFTGLDYAQYICGVSGNEVQNVTVDAAGGTYTLTFDGQTTGDIAFDADAATIKTALAALSNLDAADLDVTGTGPYQVVFSGQWQNTDVPALTADVTNLTGGGQDVSVSTLVGGQTSSWRGVVFIPETP